MAATAFPVRRLWATAGAGAAPAEEVVKLVAAEGVAGEHHRHPEGVRHERGGLAGVGVVAVHRKEAHRHRRLALQPLLHLRDVVQPIVRKPARAQACGAHVSPQRSCTYACRSCMCVEQSVGGGASSPDALASDAAQGVQQPGRRTHGCGATASLWRGRRKSPRRGRGRCTRRAASRRPPPPTAAPPARRSRRRRSRP